MTPEWIALAPVIAAGIAVLAITIHRCYPKETP
ncbi:hypothetical protein KALB_4898 [Kutzneria albida DSM 43870]|uniref:Uncharacterized protein n=1 Tax=Kutzneria albida DSM 43870 TaxID=1449976 RepID=W5WBY0_9PSEU|nr:hypothetical protein KALB_4898 [Kutzneria albida DSM 43870]